VQLAFSFEGPLPNVRDGAKRVQMLSGLAGLMLVAAAPATYGPALPAPPKPAARAPSPEACKAPEIKDDATEIVVCAVKPNGYRLDPDVMQAKKQAKDRRSSPKAAESFTDNTCASVGPRGCGGGGVNLLAAAITAVTMATKAAKGENVGKMFVTDPEPDEYQLYERARREREAKEAEAAALARANAAPEADDEAE
jgi:hypothetical protein